MKTRLMMTILCCIMACTVSAQKKKYDLPPSEQHNIQLAAIDKVNRFQSTCALIAGKKTTRVQKTSYINTTMKDFQTNARIIITGFDGTSENKPVREYLEKLSLLSERYARIEITWTDCHITDEFEYDANTGMYIGWAQVTQKFNALTGERIPLNDVVERTVKIYAKKTVVYDKNRVRKRWVIQLGDITARNI